MRCIARCILESKWNCLFVADGRFIVLALSLFFCYVLPSPASGSRLWSVLSAANGVFASQWWIPGKHEYDGSLPLQRSRGVCCAPAATLPGESCWKRESCCNTGSELSHYAERGKQGESEWICDCPEASRKRGGKGVWFLIRLLTPHSVNCRRGSARACRTSRARPYRTRRRTRRTTFCTCKTTTSPGIR